MDKKERVKKCRGKDRRFVKLRAATEDHNDKGVKRSEEPREDCRTEKLTITNASAEYLYVFLSVTVLP
ncbi:hypothetical protein DPX16_17704 [Anabarilius grahami]|uniref:Uncharacterized protein n=1 Tax=Anabarilius grahami TaxID=495550 RepID=A0A3N0YIH2_ANAGA|nr:hypothetical protein DPX16_17704 [Anabarilius grahami]